MEEKEILEIYETLPAESKQLINDFIDYLIAVAATPEEGRKAFEILAATLNEDPC